MDDPIPRSVLQLALGPFHTALHTFTGIKGVQRVERGCRTAVASRETSRLQPLLHHEAKSAEAQLMCLLPFVFGQYQNLEGRNKVTSGAARLVFPQIHEPYW